MVLHTSSLAFTVRRCPAELVAPANATPHELKLLSDIDDQSGLRYSVTFIHFYHYEPSTKGKDPVQVIRQALAKTLVFFYPFAGRLREGPGGKLMVDCNGEGVMFIEADADVALEQFGKNLQPPFPCFHDLLYDVPGSDGMINCPLLLIQVTRLKCGGFTFGSRINHTMSDGIGIFQFMKALAEIACGAPKPSILPVWSRKLLSARDPPRVTCIHREYHLPSHGTKGITNTVTPHHRSFFFGPSEMASIYHIVPNHLAQSTFIEVLTACLWRCRTAALQGQNPNEEVRLLCIVSARFGRCKFNPPLPEGFYGNAFVYPAAVTTVGKLCGHPLGYALELVKKAKGLATEEYVHSVADLMATEGRPYFIRAGSFMISDLTKLGFRDVNFGWGTAVFGGPAEGKLGDFHGVSVYISSTNAKGEEGIVVPIYLPADAMERFVKELDETLNNPNISSNL